MESSDLHPSELRDQVTSPNGATQAALESFSADELRTIVRHAVESAKLVRSNCPMSKLSGGTLVVTGGAGLIGSAIIW